MGHSLLAGMRQLGACWLAELASREHAALPGTGSICLTFHMPPAPHPLQGKGGSGAGPTGGSGSTGMPSGQVAKEVRRDESS